MPSISFSSGWSRTCVWQLTLWGYCCLNSLLSTGLITVDRYIFITRGIHYRRIVTPRRVAAAVALSWLAPAAVAAVKPATMLMGEEREEREWVAKAAQRW